MAIKVYKPTTPARRHTSVAIGENVSRKNKPLKKLTTIRKQKSGRNNQGRITVRHRGGGAKQLGNGQGGQHHS